MSNPFFFSVFFRKIILVMYRSTSIFFLLIQVLDQKGVGQLIKVAVERGRRTRPDLKVSIIKCASCSQFVHS